MLHKILKAQFYCFLVLVLLCLDIAKSYAIYDGARHPVAWNDENACYTGSFEFNPFGGNKDANWELSNPVCIGFIVGQGALIVAAGIYTKYYGCGNPTNPTAVAMAQAEKAGDPVPDMPFISAGTLGKLIYRNGLCSKRMVEYNAYQNLAVKACTSFPVSVATCAQAQSFASMAASDVANCCGAFFGSYALAVGIGVGILGGIHAVAKKSFDTAKVCGNDWNVWKKVDKFGDFSDSENDIWRRGNYPGSYQDCLDDVFINNKNKCSLQNVDGVAFNKTSVRNKYYREFLYGGREYVDSACENPASWSEARKLAILGYTDSKQRYYMRGPSVVSSYGCHRFSLIGSADDVDSANAYECCKNRSQNTICIESEEFVTNNKDHDFCKFGHKCKLNGVEYETYYGKTLSNFLCAKTYSVCPYNHLLGGGTEAQEFKESFTGHPSSELQNYCQYLKHCVKIPLLPKIRISDLKGAFISKACKDLKGDSQNSYGFNSEVLPTPQNVRGFSAPIIQCFKETIENLLLNKAGHTKCANPDELPNVKGECKSGYFYRENSYINKKSFFIKVQEGLQGAIKMALTVAIVLFGIMILIGGGQPIPKKQMFAFIIKIGIVMYFALGNAWQSGFVEGLLGSSQHLAMIMLKIDDVNVPEEKKDGCQFPRFNYQLNSSDENFFKNPKYPPGKEYLGIWDMLDCKLARAIGYGPEVSVPNLAKMIFAGFLTGGLGIMFFLAAMFFAFFFLSMILRAMHIFLMSMTAIVILIYVSPITITLMMFSKTKSVFDNWVKQILGLSLQPVILFAYLGIFISIFNVVLIGDVTYSGDGKEAPKMIVCDSESKQEGIYCIFGVAKIKTYSGLEAIGIGLPTLVGMNKNKLNALIKATILMLIFSKFMDGISTLAEKLVGGSELKTKDFSVADMMKTSYGVARGVQKRVLRATKKIGKAAAKGIGGRVKSGVNAAGNKGKSVKKPTAKETPSTDDVGSPSNATADAGNPPTSSTNAASNPPSGASNEAKKD